MSSEFAIEARQIGKCYNLYEHEGDRVKQLLWGRWLRPTKPYFREFWALKEVSFWTIRDKEIYGWYSY